MEENELEWTELEKVLNTKLVESEDKYLRLAAEFDNYKKRTQKEKEDIVTATKVKMLSSILDMDSDLSIALKSVNNDEVKEGFSLISNKLNNFLKNQGIEAIQTDSYDSELHEVISILEIGEEKIVDVVTKGYTLNGKPFRYPKIILGR
jgi:molecular chaperone GrpE